MAEGRTGAAWFAALPESVRAPLMMIGISALLAVTVGLYGLGTVRDRGVAAATAETEQLAAQLLEEPAVLRGGDAATALGALVLASDEIRAATLQLGAGNAVVAVGAAPPAVTEDDVEAAVVAGAPVVTTEDGAVLVATAIAQLEGEPVVLVTRTPQRTVGLGWTGILLLWLLLAGAIVVVSVALERRRRDRVLTLEETVRSLYAHDTQVTREQQALLRTKTDFVSAISQELRTPLQVIKGIADRLGSPDELTDGERRDLVDALGLNADRLDGLLGDLVDVDRLTQRTVTVRRRPVRIADALVTALDEIDTADHVVRLQVGDVTANATPAHVERILRALVHNAVKYAPAGSTIVVGAERDGDGVQLRVDDEGPGVAPADRAAVFEPLRQLGDEPGMGLGLALVKRFAELHGGRVWVEAAPGGGASFRVLLPDDGAPVRVDTWRVAGANVDTEVDAAVARS